MTNRKWLAALTILFTALSLSVTYADIIIPVNPSNVSSGPDISDDESYVDHLTFKPKVTALRSLNARLSRTTDVYYIPKLAELTNLKNDVSDCKDFAGVQKKFAVVYDGYFDSMEGEIYKYKNTDSARELSILGTDLLLHNEYARIISANDVTYYADKVDVNQGVPLGTAIMDIYKAVGKSIINNTYVFERDDSLNVETSPIQEQINLLLDNSDTIDVSDGSAWVFSTRTNPDSYWKLAVQNGIVSDADMSGSGRSKTSVITLAQFCDYAYKIMYVTGEPVMTQSEKNILLQLYGSSVPYKSCTDDEILAIETFIAKGIISPDEDGSYMNFGSELNFKYMLTLLMRIADVNSRATYKDVQITMDANLLSNNYYNAKLSTEVSPIQSLEIAQGSARVTSYYDYAIDKSDLLKAVDEVYPDLDIALKDGYMAGHLVFKSFDDKYYSLSTKVGAYKRSVFTDDTSTHDITVDGPLMQFCISDGIVNNQLRLRLVSFDVEALMRNGKYEIHVMSDDGKVSETYFIVNPGGGTYTSSGIRLFGRDESLITDAPLNLSNQDIIDELIDLYFTNPPEAQKRYYETLNEGWTDDEKAAAYEAAFRGIKLASDATYTYYLQITKDSEKDILVSDKTNTTTVSLADIMAKDPPGVLGDADDLVFTKITDTLYQVDNCPANNVVGTRIKGKSVSSYDMAFCKQDEELVVSAKWLKESGFINKMPSEVSDGVICISNDYMNVYLDNKNKYVVVGACVYSCTSIDTAEQIWFKTSDGEYFLNYRAALGWTGDFLVFKNEGGTISVSIDQNAFISGAVASKLHDNAMGIMLYSPPANTGQFAGFNSLSVTVLGNGDKQSIPMTAMYPFANYLIYIDDNVFNTGLEYHDWLFVFKPKNIKLNGQSIIYDDTASRQYLVNNLQGFGNLSKDVTVWAYPLYKADTGPGMPAEMSWSEKYGYVYTPLAVQELSTAYENYFDSALVNSQNGNPKYTLPFIKTASSILCFNYNVFTYEKSDNSTETIDYGKTPYNFLSANKLNNCLVYPTMNGSYLSEVTDGVEYNNVKVTPAITSPALSIVRLASYKASNIYSSLNGGSELYMGTLTCKLERDTNNKYALICGATKLSEDAGDLDFLIMRDTGKSTSSVGKWYSCTAYNEYEMVSSFTSDDSTTSISVPSDGLLDISIDNIDWDKFRLSNLLSHFDGGITILTILVLNIIPRVAMFLFLILIMLSVIQNVKIWRLFCVKVFDPYKFLTLNRQNVDTFKGRRMFFLSIVAMGVFGLFMDGVIIQLYAWIVRAVIIIVSG